MSENIKVKICPLSGEPFEISVSLDCRVESLKQKIADRLRTDTDNIRILLKDKKFRELRFGSLRENEMKPHCKVSVLPVMRAGLVGYVTTKSSVLLKSIPDEVLENAEIKAQIRDGDQASITLHIEDMVIVFKLQLIASEPESEPSAPSTSTAGSSTSTPTPSTSSASTSTSSSDSSDFHKKFVQYIRKGTNTQSSIVSKGKSDIPLSSELKKFLKDMVIKKLKSEMGMVKSDSDQSALPSYSKRRSATLENYRNAAKRAKILTQCQFEQDQMAAKLSSDCERENKVMRSKIAGLKDRMRRTRLQKKRRRAALPCSWANSSKLLDANSATCQTTCDSVQLAVHSVPGPSSNSYAGMKKGFLL